MSERAQAQWSGAKGLVRLAKARLLGMPLWDAAPPTTVDQRGGLAYLPGGTGVADQALVVYKQSDDTYATKDLLAAVAVPTIAHTTAVLKGDNAGNAVAATGGTDYANASHTHAAADVTSGTMATARLGSGSASSSTFLRGDQTWAAPAAGALTLVTSQSFSGASSVSLNNVFTSTYRNYRVVVNLDASVSTGITLTMRLRASGVDDNGASRYTMSGWTSTTGGAPAAFGHAGATSWTVQTAATTAVYTDSPLTFDLFNPQQAKLTAIVGQFTSYNNGTQRAGGFGGAHNQTSAYDGFTLISSSGNIAGVVRVYGYQD